MVSDADVERIVRTGEAGVGDVLAAYDRSELAYRAANETDFPSAFAETQYDSNTIPRSRVATSSPQA